MSKLTDEEFYNLVSNYDPKEENPEQVPYEEAKIKHVSEMIAQFEKLKSESNEDNKEFLQYCDRLIEQYKKELGETLFKVPSKAEIIETMRMLENNALDKDILKHLPIPRAYVEYKAQTDNDSRREADKLNFMDLQVKTKDHKKRLENYKDFLLEKLQRKKLDKSLNAGKK